MSTISTEFEDSLNEILKDMTNLKISTLDQLLPAMAKAVRECRRADGWSPLVKVAFALNAMGYDKDALGKMGQYFTTYPELFKVYQVSPTQKFISLVNADYEVEEMPQDIHSGADSVASVEIEEVSQLSEIQFNYIRPYVADIELSSSRELLAHLISYGFARLKMEGKLLRNGNFVMWNTGITSHSGCKIIGYGKIDNSGTVWISKFAESHSTAVSKWISRFGASPEAPSFPDSLERFNPEYPIRLNLQHILISRFWRFPKEYKDMLGIECECDEDCRTQSEEISRYVKFNSTFLDGSISKTLRQIKEVPDLPVRYWNIRTNSMDWLIPVDLGVRKQSLVALVLTLKEEDVARFYQAHTILNLKEAYSDARLIGPVLSNWLKWNCFA